MQSGIAKDQTISVGNIFRIPIVIQDGLADTIKNPTQYPQSKLRLKLKLPKATLDEYRPALAKGAEPYGLRGVVELFIKNGVQYVLHEAAVLKATSTEGVYAMDVNFELPEETYDMLVWVDHVDKATDDLYYNTQQLKNVRIIRESYKSLANSGRDVFYCKSEVYVPYLGDVDIQLERPVAKYCIVADDVDRYRSLMIAQPDRYPALSDLNIMVMYDGFLYEGFNLRSGKAYDQAWDLNYESRLPEIGDAAKEVQIASDYLLAETTESLVKVIVLVIDSKGNEINRTAGVEVKYKRGLVTTIKGAFLTSGIPDILSSN